MLDEDVVIKTARNNNERMLIVNVLFMAFFPALFLGENYDLVVGIFAASGIIAPVNMVNYFYSWTFAPLGRVRDMLLYSLPFLASIAIAAFAAFNPSLSVIASGDFEYFELLRSGGNVPSSSCYGALAPFSAEFVSLAAFWSGLSIFMITDSRFIIRKILTWGAVSAAAITLVGAFAVLVWNYEGELSENFSHTGFSPQWPSFCVIWCGAALAMSLYSVHKFRLFPFLYSQKFMCFCAAAVLAFFVFREGKTVHQTAVSLVAAAAFSILAFEVVPMKFNARKHKMLRYLTDHSKRLAKMRVPFVCYAAVAALGWWGAVSGAAKICADTSVLWNETAGANSAGFVSKKALTEDALKMLDSEHLLFGYGTASFPNAFSFFQGSDLGISSWASPDSDLLQKLVENGVVGLVLSSATFVFLLLRWLWKRSFSRSGIVMFATLAVVLAVSAVEAQMQSVAVLAGFWVLAMSLFRWDDAGVV